MKILQLALCHTADILNRIKNLQAELDAGAKETSGIRMQLFKNARMKSGDGMNMLEEARKDLLRINKILQNYEKQRKANSGQN